jgi:magnesium-transporting ATPase (P-type)
MKKLLTKLELVLVALFFPVLAIAADKQLELNNDGSILDFLKRIEGILLAITASLAVLFLIIGGIKYMSSAGNPQRLEDAKKSLTYAVLGFALFLLVNVVYAFLQGPQFLNIFK